MPAALDRIEQLVPELQQAGCKAEAEAMFTRAFAREEQLCRDFPRSAEHHNSLAWMLAGLNREPEKALAHALRAVELAAAERRRVGHAGRGAVPAGRAGRGHPAGPPLRGTRTGKTLLPQTT